MGCRDWTTSFDESIFLEVGHLTGLWREQLSGVHGNCGTWIHLIHTAAYEICSDIRTLETRKPRQREPSELSEASRLWGWWWWWGEQAVNHAEWLWNPCSSPEAPGLTSQAPSSCGQAQSKRSSKHRRTPKA